jgi:hypothetical protein
VSSSGGRRFDWGTSDVIGGFDFGGVLTLARLISSGGVTIFSLTIAAVAVGSVTITPVTTVSLAIVVPVAVFHLSVAVIGSAGSVAITAVVVALAAIILTGRIVATATARGDAAATRRAVAAAGSATVTGGTRIKSPGSGRRSAGPLQIRD